MKKTINILIILFLCSITMVNAQEKNKKLTRAEKKELKEQRKQEAIEATTTMIENKTFVLEADKLRDRKGRMAIVSSTINFISVNGDIAIFQFGSAHAIGYNGVGGITVEGRITSWDTQVREKSGSYYIRVSISATTGFYEITFDISATGMADATVHTNTKHRLNYSGMAVPLNESRVYKGFSR